MANNKVPLPGSQRKPLGTRVGSVAGDEVVGVSVILKPAKKLKLPKPGGALLSRAELATQSGGDPAVIDQLQAFAREHNLKVIEVSPERRTVRLEGSASDMANAFSVQLERFETEGVEYRARSGAVHVPESLAGSIEAVLGLDDRPQVRPHFRRKPPATLMLAAAKSTSYTPIELAQLYQFPTDVDGTGETIGILELGGGYPDSDIESYFSSLGINPPTVTWVSVDGGENAPTNADSADAEVLLDIEVAGAVAPGAKIVVYFAPNTTSGFQDALSSAIHDAKNKPSVISISWGAAEADWTEQSMAAFDAAAQDAVQLGVTICAAAGDGGSSDGAEDGQDHVDFPASSPYILACGGTSVQSRNGAIESETVWNNGSQGGATGGGYSVQFPLPAWQAGAGVLLPHTGGGRGVPDVAADADPETGYQVLVDGESMVIGGTSAVSPLMSGLIALLNQSIGKPLGYLNPVIYALAASAGAFEDITEGSNGSFSASPGWDACTGLGSPVGTNLLAALGDSSGQSMTANPS